MKTWFPKKVLTLVFRNFFCYIYLVNKCVMKKIVDKLKTIFWKCAFLIGVFEYAYAENFWVYDNAMAFLVLLTAGLIK